MLKCRKCRILNPCRKCRNLGSKVQLHLNKFKSLNIYSYLIKWFITSFLLSTIDNFGSSPCTSECFVFEEPFKFRIFSHAKFYMPGLNYSLFIFLATMCRYFQNFSTQKLQSGSHKYWSLNPYSLLIAFFSHIPSNSSHWKHQASSGWLSRSFLHCFYLNFNITPK